ncbi:MAG: hypothetical protein H6R10_1067 [Rhodocyclaceae bacterium]|nr:hypothetical protein [Rhodocyclaceae bacterium]
MHTRAEKPKAVQARSEEHRPAGAFQFADQRPEAQAQDRLQNLAQTGPQAGQLKAIQERADASPGVQTAAQLMALAQSGGTAQRQSKPEDEEPLQGRFEAVQRQEADEDEVAQGKGITAQRATDEDEPLQGRFAVAQRQESDEEEVAQGKGVAAQLATDEDEPLQGRFGVAQRREAPGKNQTGLPDNLKAGVESLSGMSMDHVRVHYNSSQPAQLNALAYAQGTDIHVAPGQEQHLPHEAWHVVQQAQGRVKPTRQMKAGVPVNDDRGLEREADVMGAKALQMQLGMHQADHGSVPVENTATKGHGPVQRVCYSVAGPDNDVGNESPHSDMPKNFHKNYFYNTSGTFNIASSKADRDDETGALLSRQKVFSPYIGNLDHIVPSALGGGGLLGNCRVINASDNSSRGKDFYGNNTKHRLNHVRIVHNGKEYTSAAKAIKAGAKDEEISYLIDIWREPWRSGKLDDDRDDSMDDSD